MISSLVDFDDLLKDIDFSQELRVYTDVFLEEVIGDLQDQIDVIQSELEYRENTARTATYELKKDLMPVELDNDDGDKEPPFHCDCHDDE